MEGVLDQIESERIARFLKLRLGDEAWSVDDAKAKLTKVMKEAKAGRPQLVGKRSPVVMISIEELEELMMGLQEPETWGEYFATAHDGNDDNEDIPLPKYGGRADYTLELGDGDKISEEAGIGAMDAVIEDDLELVARYMEIGDQDAASIVLTAAREVMSAKSRPETLEVLNLAMKSHLPRKMDVTVHASTRGFGKSALCLNFLKEHDQGSHIEGEVIGVRDERVYLEMPGGVRGVVYTRDAERLERVLGKRIMACVVGSKPTREGIALSFIDKGTGQLVSDLGDELKGAAKA